MAISAANVSYIRDVFQARLGDSYVYGGVWNPGNAAQGCDCSGLVGTVLETLTRGPDAMSWAHVVSTESWPYDYNTNTPASPGTVGPYGTIAIARPEDAPADAALIINIMHGGGGASSHMNCQLRLPVQVAGRPAVQLEYMESNGNHGTCTADQANPNDSPIWTDHWYLGGPISEDVPMPTSSFFADISEFQAPVDDSYPYAVISIRSNDGTYLDHKWQQNYAWCKKACDTGKLAFFLVYFVWRPNWQDSVAALMQQVGKPHPKMAVEIDIESWGGQITGDQSAGLNGARQKIADWLGTPKRVGGYGNKGDLDGLWPQRPGDLWVRGAGYGSNPNIPGQIAHQYTDGQGDYGQGLPFTCAPFGACDMNVADNLSPTDFAAACGITTTPTGVFMALSDAEQTELLMKVRYVFDQMGPGFPEWGADQLGTNAANQPRTFRSAIAALLRKVGVPNG